MAAPTIIPRKPFYMIRHAESQGNADGIVSPHKANLSNDGVEQALTELKPLVGAMWGEDQKDCYVVCSKMPRARGTKSLAFNGISIKLESKLNEQHEGTAVGVSVDDLRDTYNTKYSGKKPALETLVGEHFINDQGSRVEIAHVESEDKHKKRVIKALKRHLIDSGEKIPVFVSHGFTIKRAAEALGAPIEAVDNAGIYEFNPVGKKDWEIKCCTLVEGKVEKENVATSQASTRSADGSGPSI